MNIQRTVSMACLSAMLWITCSIVPSSRFATAATINLDFNSLPSAQGWTYDGDPEESTAASVDGTMLDLSTIALGEVGANYRLANALDENMLTTLRLRARVAEYEQISSGSFGLGFNVGIADGNWVWLLHFTDNDVFQFGGSVVNVDTSMFHDYRLEMRPNGSASLFIDGMLRDTGMGNAVAFNRINFGDSTDFENTAVEITEFSITQRVPEPATSLLFLMASAAVWIGRRVF